MSDPVLDNPRLCLLVAVRTVNVLYVNGALMALVVICTAKCSELCCTFFSSVISFSETLSPLFASPERPLAESPL